MKEEGTQGHLGWVIFRGLKIGWTGLGQFHGVDGQRRYSKIWVWVLARVWIRIRVRLVATKFRRQSSGLIYLFCCLAFILTLTTQLIVYPYVRGFSISKSFGKEKV